MKLKDYKKSATGSVKVEPDVLNEAKKLCKQNGVLISFYVTEAIKEKLLKDKSK